MSLKQDRTGTRTSEDLRRRLNVGDIADAADKVDASVEQVQKLSNQVSGLNNAVTDTRKNYVSTVNQSFTTEQKKIARQNIGAGTSSFSGSYNDLKDRPTKVSEFTNDAGYIKSYTETDPTVPTHVKNITEADISKWNSGTGGGGTPVNVVNTESTSTTDTYSCDYINKQNTYSTEEMFTGKYWVDGEKIYRKVLTFGALGDTETSKTFNLNGSYRYVLDFRPYLTLHDAVNLIPIHIDETTHIEAEASSNGIGDITIIVKRGNAGAWFDWNFDCVIEYTKIND